MNRWSQEQILLIAAGICLFALFADKMILTPMLNHWDDNTTRIQQLQQDLQKGEMLMLRERALRRTWREMQRDALPNEISVAENQVITAVDRWVNESRISLSSFKPQWREFEENYMTMDCRAVAQGNMEEIARFLYELERDPLALKIESLELSERDGTGNLLSLSLRFSGLQLLEEES